MQFILRTVTRINRGWESIESINWVFETENEEILALAKTLWAEFVGQEVKVEEATPKTTKKSKNVKI